MHTIWQLTEKWWVTLGLGALLWEGLKKIAGPVMGFLLDHYDRPVWDVVKVPRHMPRVTGIIGGISQPPPILIPYTTKEISGKIRRPEFFVTSSLKRLEKRGKVKETHEGWVAA